LPWPIDSHHDLRQKRHSRPRAKAAIVQSEDHARERFSQWSIAKCRGQFEPQHIFSDEACGHHDGFSIGAIQEEQIVAEILLRILAEETFSTRRGVRHHDAVAHAPVRFCSAFGIPRSAFRNDPGEFVSEHCGWNDHLRVIPAFEDLEVGPAGERRLDAHADFPVRERALGRLFDTHIFFSIEHRGFH
jgi:hypothetical protein